MKEPSLGEQAEIQRVLRVFPGPGNAEVFRDLTKAWSLDHFDYAIDRAAQDPHPSNRATVAALLKTLRDEKSREELAFRLQDRQFEQMKSQACARRIEIGTTAGGLKCVFLLLDFLRAFEEKVCSSDWLDVLPRWTELVSLEGGLIRDVAVLVDWGDALRRRRKCLHCQKFFAPDARNRHHQRFCGKRECRRASKRASQRQWHGQPENAEYFRGPDQVARVRTWRRAHPGYWKGSKRKRSDALQDLLITQSLDQQKDAKQDGGVALQDHWQAQTTCG